MSRCRLTSDGDLLRCDRCPLVIRDRRADGVRGTPLDVGCPQGVPAKSRGLGDTVAKITRATGIDRLVKAVAKKRGKPCGCAGRQAALNKAVPY